MKILEYIEFVILVIAILAWTAMMFAGLVWLAKTI